MRALAAFALALLFALPASADWTVAHRTSLPPSGQPIDLASWARPGDDTVRVALVGSYSFAYDGSEIDAMSRSVSGRRDVAAGPFVVLPAGAAVVESDPVAHRYTIEAPAAASMPLAFNLMGLATSHLLTVSEASAQLSGAIEVEHLVSPPPPPSRVARATSTVRRGASSIGIGGWALGGLGVLLFGGLGLVWRRRRRDPVAVLLRRASRARAAVAREVIALGPAYDPVSASADRIAEATAQQAAHHRALAKALERTAWTQASRRRMELTAKRAEVFAQLAELVDRLEDTATQLAGRSADADRARGVDALVDRLDGDLGAAVAAEEELGI